MTSQKITLKVTSLPEKAIRPPSNQRQQRKMRRPERRRVAVV
jgi:hypothetical protein